MNKTINIMLITPLIALLVICLYLLKINSDYQKQIEQLQEQKNNIVAVLPPKELPKEVENTNEKAPNLQAVFEE